MKQPYWFLDLLCAWADWIYDALGVLPLPHLLSHIPAAYMGAEHELDYYTRQQGNWWMNPDGTVTFTGTIYTFPNGEEMQGIVVVHAADGSSATIPAMSESSPK